MVPTPVLAFDPPAQGTDNATDVILWHGDNLTIETIKEHNLAITEFSGLEDALVAAAEAQATAINENNTAIAADAILLVLVALLIALAFGQKSWVLYALASPVGVVYGLSLATGADNNALWVVGVVIAIIGTYLLYRIIIAALGWRKKKDAE